MTLAQIQAQEFRTTLIQNQEVPDPLIGLSYIGRGMSLRAACLNVEWLLEKCGNVRSSSNNCMSSSK